MKTEAEDMDDVPVSVLIARKAKENEASSSAAASITKSSGDNSDSDDDIPIMRFIVKKLDAIEKEEKAKEQEREREKRKREERDRDHDRESSDRKKDKSSKRESELPVEKPKVSSSSSSTKSGQFYSSCEKGRLVQALLIRWWYAYDWPRPEDIGVPPAGYEALDGFPGVFLDSLGNILDLRDREKTPSLVNFSKKSSRELQRMCIAAIENQMAQLAAAEGNKNKLYANLKAELAEISRIDPDTADRHAKKFEGCFQSLKDVSSTA